MARDYDRHSDPQLRDALSRADLVRRAAERIRISDERAEVVIADYGCGPGLTTMAMVGSAVRAVRNGRPDEPILTVHSDLLDNDWGTLLGHLQGSDSYLAVDGGPITPTISATSFYEPATPHGVVDLGLSFAALQWLATPGPTDAGTAIYFDQLPPSSLAAMASQAHSDWTRFLELRAGELAPSGRLVVDMMGRGHDQAAAGRDAWAHTRSICEELCAEGGIEPDRMEAYVIPIYERTLDEVRRPFDEAVGELLTLEELSIADSTIPAVERYRTTGDRAEFAGNFTGFFRAFSEPSLTAALQPAEGAIDELYRRLAVRLAESADDFDFTVHLVTAEISARSR